jgi:hypothetical protein
MGWKQRWLSNAGKSRMRGGMITLISLKNSRGPSRALVKRIAVWPVVCRGN